LGGIVINSAESGGIGRDARRSNSQHTLVAGEFFQIDVPIKLQHPTHFVNSGSIGFA
jgi:hypothetical protein